MPRRRSSSSCRAGRRARGCRCGGTRPPAAGGRAFSTVPPQASARGETKNGTKPFSAREEAVAHRFVDRGRARFRLRQVPVEGLVDEDGSGRSDRRRHPGIRATRRSAPRSGPRPCAPGRPRPRGEGVFEDEVLAEAADETVIAIRRIERGGEDGDVGVGSSMTWTPGAAAMAARAASTEGFWLNTAVTATECER